MSGFNLKSLYKKLLSKRTWSQARARVHVFFTLRAYFSYDKTGEDVRVLIPMLTMRAAAESKYVLLEHLLAFENFNEHKDPQVIFRYFGAVLTGCASDTRYERGSPHDQRWALRHLREYFTSFDMKTVSEATGKSLFSTAACFPDNAIVLDTLNNLGQVYTYDPVTLKNTAAIHALRKGCFNNAIHIIEATQSLKRGREQEGGAQSRKRNREQEEEDAYSEEVHRVKKKKKKKKKKATSLSPEASQRVKDFLKKANAFLSCSRE